MSRFAHIVCILIAGAAVLPMSASAGEAKAGMAQVKVPHRASVLAACADGVRQLPAGLYQAWRDNDMAADALVEFRLDGDKVSDVTVTGDAVSRSAIRHAVRTMKCAHQGDGAYALSFRIKFRYPEDGDAPVTAMQFVDEAPRLVLRD